MESCCSSLGSLGASKYRCLPLHLSVGLRARLSLELSAASVPCTVVRSSQEGCSSAAACRAAALSSAGSGLSSDWSFGYARTCSRVLMQMSS